MFEYDCPGCGMKLEGSFGDNVHCKDCNKTYETEWDWVSEDSMSAWIVCEINI